MESKKLSLIIGLLLGLVALRGMMYSVLIPFDRSPDEKAHFQQIKAKQLQLMGASDQDRQQAAADIEVAVRYLQYPEMPAGRYNRQQYPNAKLPGPPSALHIYYWTGAKLLQMLALPQIRDEMYVIRGLSVLCGVVTVWLSFLMTRDLFPDHRFLLIGVPALIAFIPQFSAMSAVINNDKFAEVFLAIFFWLLVKIFKNGLHWGYLMAALAVVGGSILGKRTAVFAMLVVLMMVIVYYWKHFPGLRLSAILVGMLVGLAVVGYFGLVYSQTVYALVRHNPLGVQIWIPVPELQTWEFYQNLGSPAMLKFYAKFLTLLYWSFWGVFGYMDIHLHHFWYVAAAVVQLLAIGGTLHWMHKQRSDQTRQDWWQAKVIYLFMASICAVMLVVFFRSIVFRPGQPMLDQGRRLFTTILPISFLTVFGVEQLLAPPYRRVLGTLGLGGLIVMDIVSLSNYILLNFHLRAFWG